MKPRAAHWRAHESAQSMVEFALVVPILVLILMGVFDLGRAIYYYNVVNNTAHEAARAAITCGGKDATNCSTQDGDAKTKAVNTTAGVPITTSDITITPTTRKNGDLVTARVTVTFTPITPLIGTIIGGSQQLTLSAQSSMIVQ